MHAVERQKLDLYIIPIDFEIFLETFKICVFPSKITPEKNYFISVYNITIVYRNRYLMFSPFQPGFENHEITLFKFIECLLT